MYIRKNHDTPRLLTADAYTVGSDKFQSRKARRRSVYYGVFRRELIKINPDLYSKGDNRILFFGLQKIVDRLFFEPITHEEIDQAKKFLVGRKVTTRGFKDFWFPEQMWRDIVDKYNGFPPILIEAMPEGSVVYPNEPVLQVESLAPLDENMGELAAWFESKLLQVWASSERGTQDRHWYNTIRSMMRSVDPSLTDEQVNFQASIFIHDFGDRSGMNQMESEDQGMTALYTFTGTDTFAGAYQAFMNNGQNLVGIGTSVNALAHRNVQAYETEDECYQAIYDASEEGELVSMVNDCYNSRRAVHDCHVRLALHAKKANNGKVVVSRPDSNDPLEEILYIIGQAIENGLYEDVQINGETWKVATTLRILEGDGMTYPVMIKIMNELIDRKFLPWGWLLFGVGGGQRNSLKRDNTGAKYALCAYGDDYEGVVKFSDTFGKTTLPGPFKVLRSAEALANKKTIVFRKEEGENSMVVFYNGLLGQGDERFGIGMYDTFMEIRDRSHHQFDSMPLTLTSEDNHNYPASDEIITKRRDLLRKYAPDKDAANY